jgi:hypothetical protein
VGRPAIIEENELAALIVALQGQGITSTRASTAAIAERTEHRVSKSTVARWLQGQTGSVALAARRAKPAPTNGHAKAKPKVGAVEPVELGDEDALQRAIRGFLALGEHPDATVSERTNALDKAAKYAFLARFGALP